MAEQFSGKVDIVKDIAGEDGITITLDGNTGDITAGGSDTDGDLLLKNSAGNWTIRLDGEEGDIIVQREIGGAPREVMRFYASSAALYIGGIDSGGDLIVQNASGEHVFRFDSEKANLHIGRPPGGLFIPPPGPGLTVRDWSQRRTLRFNGNSADLTIGVKDNEGDIHVQDNSGKDVFHFDGGSACLDVGANGHGGGIRVRDNSGKSALIFGGTAAGVSIGAKDNAGDIYLQDYSGKSVFRVNGHNAELCIGAYKDNAGTIRVKDNSGKQVLYFNGGSAALYIGANGHAGTIRVRDNSGNNVLSFGGINANLFIGRNGHKGGIYVRDNSGNNVFQFDGRYAALYIGAKDNEGDIRVLDNSGNVSIHLDGATGDIKLHGADCSEEFDVAESEEIDPGTVLVIDDESKLRPCRGSYDKKVAGVVSGAYGAGPGIILGKNSAQSKRLPIALNGKVYCKVDAQYSPIEVGDLLTTSDTPGHAMKVADPVKAFGTVIGKALRPLREGSGMIPILVALQ